MVKVAHPARGAAPANDCGWLDRFKADAKAARRDVGTFDCLDRMETLARRLDIGSRQIGEALMEAAECPALAENRTLLDALETSIMLDEQIDELTALVERAHGTLRGLDGMAGDHTALEDPGTVFLAVQAAFNAGEVPEADFDAAYEKVAVWQPATPLEFTRKALCLLGDGKLPERDIIDRLMEQAARLAA